MRLYGKIISQFTDTKPKSDKKKLNSKRNDEKKAEKVKIKCLCIAHDQKNKPIVFLVQV